MAKQNIHEIEKFNPYHDARGRFTNGSGATSFTIRAKDPKKQYLVDRAIEREKQKYKASESKPEMMFSGQHIKQGEPMTHKEADNSNCNPNYFWSDRFRSNCQSCVVAYEMRRRGWDVEAVAEDFKNNELQHELAKHSETAWKESDGTPAQFCANSTRNRWVSSDGYNLTKRLFAKEIEDAIGDEGRYTISFSPKGSRQNGHIVMAFRDQKGILVIFDPQSGKHNSAESLASEAKVQGTQRRRKYNCHPQIMRVDDKQPVKKVIDAVLKPSQKQD